MSSCPIDANAQTFIPNLPVPNGVVRSVKYDMIANMVYIGGDFTQVDGQPRNHLASIDMQSGTLTSWDPNVNGAVYAMQVGFNMLYVGGDFTTVGTTSRARLAAFSTPDGMLTPWDPSTNGLVRTIDLQSTTAYIGGDFTMVGGLAVPHVGGVSTSGIGAPISCVPSYCNDRVRSLRVHGSVFWVGGDFDQVGGSSREHVAALNATNCGATAWNPDVDGPVYGVSEGYDTDIHIVGSFQNVGGQQRQGVATINVSSGNATNWDAHCDGEGRCVAGNYQVLFVGGQFDHIGGEPRNGFAAVRLSDGVASIWDPALGNGASPVVVHSISSRGTGFDFVFAGGDFQTVGGTFHPYFAAWAGQFTGMREMGPVLGLSAHPNPCTGVLYFDTDLPAARTILVRNILGQGVLKCPFQRSIDLSSLDPSIYILTILGLGDTVLGRVSIIRN